MFDLFKHFNLRLACACTLIAVSQFNYGFDNSGFSATQAMPAFERQFGVYSEEEGTYIIQPWMMSMMNSLPYIGFAIGLLIGSVFSARFGRRMTMATMSAYCVITTTIVITSTDQTQMLTGRVLHYLYLGFELAVIPIFQSEIAPPAVRGMVVGTYQLSIILGGIVMNGVCYETATMDGPGAYRIPFGMFYILPAFVLVLVWFVPESPRWLLLKDRIEDAQQAHRLYRVGTMSDESIALEFDAMQQSLINEPEQGSFKELFQGLNLKRTAIVFGIAVFQQVTGQAFVSQYGTVYIRSLGTIDPFAMSIGNSAVCGAGIVLTLLTVDKIGRRRLLLLGSVIQFAAVMTMGGLGVQDPVPDDNKAGIVACMAIFVFGFGVGWGPLTFVVATELPAIRLRDRSQRVAALTNIFFQFAVNFTIPYLVNAPYAELGSRVGFIYGSFAFCAFIFVFFCVPECSGRSLDEIDTMFRQRIPPRKFKTHPRISLAEQSGHDMEGKGELSIHVEERVERPRDEGRS